MKNSLRECTKENRGEEALDVNANQNPAKNDNGMITSAFVCELHCGAQCPLISGAEGAAF